MDTDGCQNRSRCRHFAAQLTSFGDSLFLMDKEHDVRAWLDVPPRNERATVVRGAQIPPSARDMCTSCGRRFVLWTAEGPTIVATTQRVGGRETLKSRCEHSCIESGDRLQHYRVVATEHQTPEGCQKRTDRGQLSSAVHSVPLGTHRAAASAGYVCPTCYRYRHVRAI